MIEHPVAHSQGDIVFNPGGPGESGVLILPILASFVPPVVLRDFTLVSFDERGTGSSKPLLCGPSVVAAGSAVAGSVAAGRVFAGLERSCRSADPALFPTVDTTTSARDMNQLRMALGVRRINYYGVSYGTVLGSVYRQLFPSHVRSMVLDGAVDANLSLATDATLEAPAIQAAIEYELGRCTAAPGCPLGADPVSFYQDLEQRLARSPLPGSGGGRQHTGHRGRSGHGHTALPVGAEPHRRLLPGAGLGRRRQRGPAADGGGGVGNRPQRQVTGRPAVDHHL